MFLNSKIFTIPLLVLSVWMLLSVISLEVEKRESAKEVRSIEAKINDTRRGSELLEKFIKHFDNPLFIEKEARLRLNYKIAGEEVVFVHRDLNSKKASESEEFFKNRFSVYKEWLSRLVSF